ncbi:unnamed protein product [Ectocarpus sp. 12 AP-2014]
MAEHDLASASPGSVSIKRATGTFHLGVSEVLSGSVITSPSANHAEGAQAGSVGAAATESKRRYSIDSMREKPCHTGEINQVVRRPLGGDDAVSTSKDIVEDIPAEYMKQQSPPAHDAVPDYPEQASVPADAFPVSLPMREKTTGSPQLLIADTLYPSQESSAAQDQAHQPKQHHLVQQASSDPVMETRNMDGTNTAAASSAAAAAAAAAHLTVETQSLQRLSSLEPAAEEVEDGKEDDGYRYDYLGVGEGEGGEADLENRLLSSEGQGEPEREDDKGEESQQGTTERTRGGRQENRSEGGEHGWTTDPMRGEAQGGGVGASRDPADEAKQETATTLGESAQWPAVDHKRSQSLTDDKFFSELSVSTGMAAAAKVLADSPSNEGAELRECSGPRLDGENDHLTQTPAPALPPVDSNTQLSGDAKTLPLETTRQAGGTGAVAAFEPTGIGTQPALRHQRRASYMPGQAMRPGRSAARASVQLALPPIVTEEEPAPAKEISNADAVRTIHEAAQSEVEEPDQPMGGQTWKEYHALHPGRQHSTADLVAYRRTHIRQLSVELFGEGDDTSSSSSTSTSDGEADVDEREERKDKDLDTPLWPQSDKGRSMMEKLTKVTVAVESPATKISRKYLKLFAPSNSAHDTYKVLATLHRRMNGTGWPRRGGWDSYLVRRSRVELDEGRVYGVRSKEGSVEYLILSSNNVCGRIPPIIARLESLKCINLSDNHISGTIPVELGLLLQLQTLQLQGNNLRDNISPLLGSLISLIRLSLGHNKLSGPLPDSLGNLLHLEYFSAENNHLSGGIPNSISRMTALKTFNVSNNELSGAIPANIGSLARLKKLELASNRLSGTIPTSMGTLSALNWLRVENNQLTGPIPASFGDLKELLILDLSSNRLSGPLPAALGTLPNLTTVCLRGNAFEGPFQLPVKFQFWFLRSSGATGGSGMRSLNLGSNEVEEPFPDLQGMGQLQSLVLDQNRMYGGLTESLAETCPNLYRLSLQKNRLSGEIPHSLGMLTKLEHLDLSDNCFEGGLPPSMESMQLLKTFSASNNNLSGDLPSFLGKLTLLTSLALDGNQFSGTLPRELGNLTVLERLYLERNAVVGSIPAELSTCLALEELYLHDNKMWGKIPDSLRALRGLRYFYLYRNKITGTVPEWLGELSSLRGLVLGENRLRGHIPWQLGHLHKLQDLYLNDNNLDGSIPERMVMNCECLQRLYLGGNRLSGTVPRYLRHVRDLRELNIERNKLHGEIPIPLFLKASLGPNACGFKWAGNPRIVDSRHHFASVAGLRRAGGNQVDRGTATPPSKDQQQQQHSTNSSFKPIPLTLRVPDLPGCEGNSRLRGSGYQVGAKGEFSQQQQQGSEELDREVGIGVMEEGYLCEDGEDGTGASRLWANSEDFCYFLFKVVVGNALVLIDLVIAAR